MKNLLARVQFFANVAIIIVAALIVTVLIFRYVHGDFSPAKSSVASPILRGTLISVPNISWNKKRTLLFVLSTRCRFCSESAPFYQRLVQETAGLGDIHLVAVFPQQPDSAKRYLSELGLTINEVTTARLDSLGVRGTPTLILVDDTGHAIDSWVGKLAPEQETRVLSQLLQK